MSVEDFLGWRQVDRHQFLCGSKKNCNVAGSDPSGLASSIAAEPKLHKIAPETQVLQDLC